MFAAARGGTALAHSHVRAPLKIVRPFPLACGRALVQVLTLGPGMCGGDHWQIDITVEDGASAVVIMQSASRLLGMAEGADARHDVRLSVQGGGHLEYYPGLTIPFAGSSFIQRVHADVHQNARFGILETWTTGRSSRGEHLQFRRISSRTTVAVGGAVAYGDAIEIDPSAAGVAGTGMLEGHRYLAAGFWHGVPTDDAAETGEDGLIAFAPVRSGQLYLRALTMEGSAIAKLAARAVDRVNASWNLPPIPLRRFTS